MIGTFQILPVASTNPNLPRLNQLKFPYLVTAAGVTAVQLTIDSAYTRTVTLKQQSDAGGDFYSDAGATALIGKSVQWSTTGDKLVYFKSAAAGTLIIDNADGISKLGRGTDYAPQNQFIPTTTAARITGFQISQLSACSQLTHVNLLSHDSVGDLSVFTPKVNMTNITISADVIGGITGTMATLAPLAALRYLSLGGCSVVDAFLLPRGIQYLTMNNTRTGVINFSGDGTVAMCTLMIRALDLRAVGRPVTTETDNMLKSLALAPASTTAVVFSIRGTRTSASDAAVATLAGKNYTITFS